MEISTEISRSVVVLLGLEFRRIRLTIISVAFIFFGGGGIAPFVDLLTFIFSWLEVVVVVDDDDDVDESYVNESANPAISNSSQLALVKSCRW